MDFIIHYSFKDFIKDYQGDFLIEKTIYPDITIEDYFKELKPIYKLAVKNVHFIEIDYSNVRIMTEAEFTGETIDEVLDKIKYYDDDGLQYDFEEARKLKYSFSRILEFIENKSIISPTIETANENPEIDFSDNSDKVKLIMLEKLGIINYIKTIQTKPETISHTSEILSAITGIDSKTLNTYLYPMLRPHRDDDDKNSPYKNRENLEKAERELIKLKIKI